jgi:tyrosinase
MGSDERKAYIEAVQCMLSSPSKSNPVEVPGARVRQTNPRIEHNATTY